MRHGGEYFFEYKDVYCLLDNDRISTIFEEINVPAQKRVAYFHSLPGLHEIEDEIQDYLEEKCKKDINVFMQEYYSNEYYDDDAQYILSFYLKGYAGKIGKACYGEYFNKEIDRHNCNSIFGCFYKLDNKDGCSVSLFTINKLLFRKTIKFNGHIYFSKKDIMRLNGSLLNFFVELQNGITINFNQNYVDIYVTLNNYTIDEEVEDE